MVRVVKHEWHRVDSQFVFDFTEEILAEIYPDYSEEEIIQLLRDLESGDVIPDDIVEDALDNNVDIDWEPEYDDWYTSRKGGFEVTYDVDTDTNFKEDE